jgi:hypothetical protein
MSNDYQAVYDAVRSRLGGCDMASVVGGAIRNSFDGHQATIAIVTCAQDVAASQQRPSVLFKPELRHHELLSYELPDGTKHSGPAWTATYGDFCGIGDTPEKAMLSFDAMWYKLTS